MTAENAETAAICIKEHLKKMNWIKRAGYLNMTTDQFKDFFLEFDEIEYSYETKHKPCDFLDEDGECRLGDMKPESCKTYPYNLSADSDIEDNNLKIVECNWSAKPGGIICYHCLLKKKQHADINMKNFQKIS